VFRHYGEWYVSISRSSQALMPPGGRFAGVIHNAIDVSSYPFNPAPRGDFLLFLSRMSREKGPHLAIQVAKLAGRRLVIAGNVDRPDEDFFRTEVEPLIDGDQIQYLGEADFHLKRELMSTAEWLLAPIQWPEPFGLFMIEAMACGTPVVVLNNGSAPEVVAHGRTGFVVESVAEMAKLVQGPPDGIDPYECRRHVECEFSVRRMTDEYVDAYHRILCSGRPPGQADKFVLREVTGLGLPKTA
jgi:glycosyltransferase involved in cell wall biosynthesis